MRITLTILTLLLSFALGNAQDKVGEKSPKRINFGARAGFNSTLLLITDFTLEGTPVNEIQHSYKVGYFSSLFMRLNFGQERRHFFQPEISYAVNKGGFTFVKPAIDEGQAAGTQAEEATINSTMHGIEVPLLYGYNFIKEGPYGLAIFGGPKVRYLLEDKAETVYNNIDTYSWGEDMNKLNLSMTVGVAITIHRIFFDFRYSMGLHNLIEKETKQVSYHCQDNVLSFSLGVFF